LRYIRAALLAAAAVVLAVILAQPARADVSFDVAYSNLSQHGSWLVSAQYGHVWQPREYNRGWSPYSDGHWVYTDMGWTWVSDYPWGAIPYHYGTWVADPDAGWVWIPGSVWAPSWVVFRTDSDYIGWAPVPPGFSVGMSIDMGGLSNFVFVSSRDFLSPRLRPSIIPMDRARLFSNNTTVVNNIVVQNNVVINRGPDFRIVERATGRTIREERIENVARVAPFDHVTRAQLAVAPERVRQGLRVAEPVPASRPLPASDRRGVAERNTSPPAASKPLNVHPATRPATREPAAPPAMARRTPTPARDAAPASSTVAKDRANAQQRTNEQAAAKAQKSRPAQTPPRDAVAPSPTAARTNARPVQSAKAQPQAKAKPDTRAKKDNPDKKDQSSDKRTTPGAKEESRP
jgi:hypothetical protein